MSPTVCLYCTELRTSLERTTHFQGLALFTWSRSPSENGGFRPHAPKCRVADQVFLVIVVCCQLQQHTPFRAQCGEAYPSRKQAQLLAPSWCPFLSHLNSPTHALSDLDAAACAVNAPSHDTLSVYPRCRRASGRGGR